MFLYNFATLLQDIFNFIKSLKERNFISLNF
jgi:hypothetical protein